MNSEHVRRSIAADLQVAVGAALILSLIDEAGGSITAGELCDKLNKLGAAEDLSAQDLGFDDCAVLTAPQPC